MARWRLFRKSPANPDTTGGYFSAEIKFSMSMSLFDGCQR